MDFPQKARKVEAEYQRLKGQVKAGALTREEAEAQLKDLMIQDDEDRWWIIGYETGRWHYHDGEKWMRGDPPMPPAPAPPQPVRRPEPFDWMMVLGGAIGFAVANVIASLVWEALGGEDIILIGATTLWGIVGGAALGFASRDTKRILVFSLLCGLSFGVITAVWTMAGYPGSQVRNVAWGTVIGFLLGIASLKKVRMALVVSLVGIIAFVSTSFMYAPLYDAGGHVLADGLRGAIVGAAFGFALSYLEKRSI